MLTIKKMNPEQQQEQQQRGIFSCLFENIHSTLRKIRTRSVSFFPLPESPAFKNTPVFRDIFEHTLLKMHDIHETLHFWQAASCQRNAGEHIKVLETLQKYLAIFVSKLYKEVVHVPDSSSLPQLLHAVNALFLDLQDSVCHINDLICCRLSFEKLGSDYDDNARLIHSNLNTLDIYLSLLINKYRKPNTMIRHWKGYTIGAIGITLFSVWLLRHTDVPHTIGNWILQAKESIANFSVYHIEEPLTTVDELLLKKQKNEMELEQLQSTFDFYYSQFKFFTERCQRQRYLANGVDQGFLVWLKTIIEKQFIDRDQDIFMEGHAVKMLNKIRKQRFDIKMEILDLNDQLSSPNEKKVTLSADLPIMVLSFGSAMMLLWVAKGVTKFTVAESKIWIARKQIRPLICEVKMKLAALNMCDILSQNEEFHFKHGLLLCTLNRLYKMLKWEAKFTAGWPCLEADISILGKTDVQHTDKLGLLSYMTREYDSCWLLRRRPYLYCFR